MIEEKPTPVQILVVDQDKCSKLIEVLTAFVQKSKHENFKDKLCEAIEKRFGLNVAAKKGKKGVSTDITVETHPSRVVTEYLIAFINQTAEAILEGFKGENAIEEADGANPLALKDIFGVLEEAIARITAVGYDVNCNVTYLLQRMESINSYIAEIKEGIKK